MENNQNKGEKCHCERTDSLGRKDSNFTNHTFEVCWKVKFAPPSVEKEVHKCIPLNKREIKVIDCTRQCSFCMECGECVKHISNTLDITNEDSIYCNTTTAIPVTQKEIENIYKN